MKIFKYLLHNVNLELEKRYIAQHWHIYQPRANDFWTEIINGECYSPNSHNGVFKDVSFNLGPTLIDWFTKNDPATLERIVSKDEGQALAQAYNHRILPLIRYPEDLETQVYWGKQNFKKHFHREPEGMWLPETATNKEVCRELAKQGIRYTIGTQFQNMENKPGVYKIELGDGLELTYFFYDAMSGNIAFNAPLYGNERFLDNADDAVSDILEKRKDSRFTLLAFDGETFGHHHKFADKWAHYFPKAVNKRDDVEMITIDKYLDRFPVEESIKLRENTAWSCSHGLERWNHGCSCSGIDYQPVLTKVLNQLEDDVHNIFLEEGNKHLDDVWDARNDYINLKLGNVSEDEFFRKHLKTKTEKQKMKALLEAEYHLQLSFTSCGWFFKDISPPTRENIKDAFRSAELIRLSTGHDIYDRLEPLDDIISPL